MSMLPPTFSATVAVPAPFHELDLFSLIEPTRVVDGRRYYQCNLYLKDRTAEGGKVLIKKSVEFPFDFAPPAIALLCGRARQ